MGRENSRTARIWESRQAGEGVGTAILGAHDGNEPGTGHAADRPATEYRAGESVGIPKNEVRHSVHGPCAGGAAEELSLKYRQRPYPALLVLAAVHGGADLGVWLLGGVS